MVAERMGGCGLGIQRNNFPHTLGCRGNRCASRKFFIDGEEISAEVFSVSENNPGEPAQPATREREVRALTDAMCSLGLDHGLILTDATRRRSQKTA